MFSKLLFNRKPGSHALDVDTALSSGPEAPAFQLCLLNHHLHVIFAYSDRLTSASGLAGASLNSAAQAAVDSKPTPEPDHLYALSP
jgi:hypothetical protein